MRDESKAFLEKYLNNVSPTGFEHSGQSIWLDYIKPYIQESLVDTYGTAVGVVNPGQPYKVVLEAHADEISWFVNYITDDGYLYVIRNGGSDFQIAPSMRCNIHCEGGQIVKGVFGWPAIHVRTDKNPDAKQENIFIDLGCSSKAEVEALRTRIENIEGLFKSTTPSAISPYESVISPLSERPIKSEDAYDFTVKKKKEVETQKTTNKFESINISNNEIEDDLSSINDSVERVPRNRRPFTLVDVTCVNCNKKLQVKSVLARDNYVCDRCISRRIG